MPIQHREIPDLPDRPRVHPIAGQIRRSYPVGRQSFSRACQGEPLALTITTEAPLPDNVQAKLVTTLNSNAGHAWADVPFVRADERTLMCRVMPERPGLHSFRAEFCAACAGYWGKAPVPEKASRSGRGATNPVTGPQYSRTSK